MTSVAIVGFGYIGSVMGAVLADKGYDVVGVDQNEALISNFSLGRCPIPEPDLQDLVAAQVAAARLTFSTDIAAIAQADVVLVTVGTPLSPDTHKADLSHIKAACESMTPYVKDGQLIILKSTVPPGVTRLVAGETLMPHAKIRLAFSPERLAEGQAIRDLKTLPIVVGGIDAESTKAAADFWRESLGVQVMELTSPEAAELVKLANNLWIDLNIALAHDLAKLCDSLPYDVDVLEVIGGANTLKKGQHYTNILTPSNGVGGYCLTKDPWFVWAIGKEHGVELLTPPASRAVNDSMPAYVADQILGQFSSENLKPSDAKIAVMGLAFKTNSGDLRFTPVGPFLDAVGAAGVTKLAVCDPMVTEAEGAHMGVAMTEDWREALRGANCAAFFVGHDAFKEISVDDLASLLAPGALVYDGRMYFTRQDIAAMTARGLVYQGVGRK